MSTRIRRGFEVTERSGERGATSRFLDVTVHPTAPQYEGHFPGFPVMPALAQLADLVLCEVALAWPELPPMSGSTRMKFSRVVAPGDRLTLSLSRAPATEVVRFELAHAEGICSSGSLRFSAKP